MLCSSVRSSSSDLWDWQQRRRSFLCFTLDIFTSLFVVLILIVLMFSFQWDPLASIYFLINIYTISRLKIRYNYGYISTLKNCGINFVVLYVHIWCAFDCCCCSSISSCRLLIWYKYWTNHSQYKSWRQASVARVKRLSSLQLPPPGWPLVTDWPSNKNGQIRISHDVWIALLKHMNTIKSALLQVDWGTRGFRFNKNILPDARCESDPDRIRPILLLACTWWFRRFWTRSERYYRHWDSFARVACSHFAVCSLQPPFCHGRMRRAIFNKG